MREDNKKMGLAIGVISGEMIPFRWMMHQMKVTRHFPGGLFWSYIYDVSKFDESNNYATARTIVVEKALKQNVKYLLFVDTDVFLPMDALTRLISHDADIITGVYWMKSTPPQPVIYKTLGDGPLWDIKPQKEPIEIGGAGLGCCLIKMSVFEKFKEAGVPFFKQDYQTNDNNRPLHVDVGEDHWFYSQARKLGFKVLCDTNVLCDHYQPKTGIFYPGDEVVEKITGDYLKEHGQGEIVEHHLKMKGMDSNKPTIVLYNANAVKFDGSSIESKPISGSETAMIQIAKNLHELGCNVHVFCNVQEAGVYDGVVYNHYSNVLEGMQKIKSAIGRNVNAFISSRDLRPFLGNGKPPADVTVLWAHDMPSPAISVLPKALENIDRIFFVSEFQKNEYQKYFDNLIPENKIFITRNGIDENRFKFPIDLVKVPGQCVYTTTPFRGLDVLMGLWPKIKEQVPHASLHVYSGMSIYNQQEMPETKAIFDYGKRIADKYDITFHEPVKQDELAKVLCKSELMVYPNHFPETSCITAMESIKARTPVITSKFGALAETIKPDEGILIEGDAYSQDYADKFIQAAVRMLKDRQFRNQFCQTDRDFSWKGVALDWLRVLALNQIPVMHTKENQVNINTKEYWERKHANMEHRENQGQKIAGEEERYEFISKLIPKDANILDIGCANGNFLKFLYDRRIGQGLYGTEIDKFAIDAAKIKVPLADFEQVSEMPQELSAKNMDIITAFHVVEHLEDPHKYIELWKKSLKPDGEMVLIIPLNDDPYIEHLKVWDLGNVDSFARSVAKDYEIKTRNQGWNYQDGRPAKEAVVRLWFN